MFDSTVIHLDECEPDLIDEANIPTLLLVGSGRPLHPVMMHKLLEMEAAGTIRIVHHCLEATPKLQGDGFSTGWFDEASLSRDTYTIWPVYKPVLKKERKPKPYYRKGERY